MAIYEVSYNNGIGELVIGSTTKPMDVKVIIERHAKEAIETLQLITKERKKLAPFVIRMYQVKRGQTLIGEYYIRKYTDVSF